MPGVGLDSNRQFLVVINMALWSPCMLVLWPEVLLFWLQPWEALVAGVAV